MLPVIHRSVQFTVQTTSLTRSSIPVVLSRQIDVPQEPDVIFLRELLAVLLFLTMASGSVLFVLLER